MLCNMYKTNRNINCSKNTNDASVNSCFKTYNLIAAWLANFKQNDNEKVFHFYS